MRLHMIYEHKPLTPSEKRVYEFLLTAVEFQDMAKTLGVTTRTIKAHAQRVYQAYNVENRVQFLVNHLRGYYGARDN